MVADYPTLPEPHRLQVAAEKFLRVSRESTQDMALPPRRALVEAAANEFESELRLWAFNQAHPVTVETKGERL